MNYRNKLLKITQLTTNFIYCTISIISVTVKQRWWWLDRNTTRFAVKASVIITGRIQNKEQQCDDEGQSTDHRHEQSNSVCLHHYKHNSKNGIFVAVRNVFAVSSLVT